MATLVAVGSPQLPCPCCRVVACSCVCHSLLHPCLFPPAPCSISGNRSWERRKKLGLGLCYWPFCQQRYSVSELVPFISLATHLLSDFQLPANFGLLRL